MPMTLGQMKAIALDMADVTGDQHIDSDRLTDWFNLELADLNDILVASEELYFKKQVEYVLTSTTQTYPLPSDHYKTIKLFYMTSNGQRRPMARMPLDEIDWDNRSDPWAFTEEGPRYEIVGGNIEVSTTQAGSMVLWYVPQFASLRFDDETISPIVPHGFEDYVIHGVAIRCRIKEESDPSMLLGKRAELKERILTMASPRDQGESQGVTDYYASHGYRRRRLERRW